MKQAKQRVIAIDYFRGICILIVLLSHSFYFSRPFSYLSGHGLLWTSAAEMFFLLSGITFSVVSGPKAISNFRGVIRKSLHRAFKLYIIYVLLVLYAVVLGFFFINRGWVFYSNNSLPAVDGFSLLWQILNLSYSLGWGDYLRFYAIFLLVAPFSINILRTRLWSLVPLTSIFIFLMYASPSGAHSTFSLFAIWQLYFFCGMTIGRFRTRISHLVYRMPAKLLSSLTLALTSLTILSISAAILLYFDVYHWVDKVTVAGWLPGKFRGAYYHLLQNQSVINFWLGDGRLGALRPIVTLMFFAAAYLLYQRYKTSLLESTGAFVNKMGSETYMVYIAQAILIPIVAALPLGYGSPAIDLMTTAVFMYAMWLVATRSRLRHMASGYFDELKEAYYRGKYAYLYDAENEI